MQIVAVLKNIYNYERAYLISSLRNTSLLLYKLLTMRSMSRLTCQWCILSKVKQAIPYALDTIQHEKQPYLSLVFISLSWWGTRRRRFCSSWFTSSTQKQISSRVWKICRFNRAGFFRSHNRKPSSLRVIITHLLLTNKTPTITKMVATRVCYPRTSDKLTLHNQLTWSTYAVCQSAILQKQTESLYAEANTNE